MTTGFDSDSSVPSISYLLLTVLLSHSDICMSYLSLRLITSIKQLNDYFCNTKRFECKSNATSSIPFRILNIITLTMVDNVRHIILVKSVKGGVGKSTVSTQLALSLWESGYRVGILDTDICGPSIPYLLNVENNSVYQSESGKWVPIYKGDGNRFAIMSIGFLLNSRDDPIIWRGPKKTSMIRQFVNDIEWGDLDYLIVDTPPGTSDEHITIMECMNEITGKCDGAVIVTTPQEVSLEDVRKEITFCRKTQIEILGIIENMNGFTCPNCLECTPIFSTDGGKALASYANIPIWGTLPIDPRVATLSRNFQSVLSGLPDSTFAEVFNEIVKNKIVKT